MISATYRAQADLMLQILPHVAKEEVFALKGGTAINLFVREMPRLSVDIDLTYLPFDERPAALTNITGALSRIKESISKVIPGITITSPAQTEGQDAKLLCQSAQATVKIEVNTVMRGQIFPVRLMKITRSAENEFEKFAAINVLSHAELFGGKICAALDRQHPRDLFDVHHLLANDGFTDDVKLGFMASLLSHPRPAHELLKPNFLDRSGVFDSQFAGMTVTPFTYADHEMSCARLLKEIHDHLTDDDQNFLLGFHDTTPDWRLFSVEALKTLPAIRWKQLNLQKLKAENPAKHADMMMALQKALRSG